MIVYRAVKYWDDSNTYNVLGGAVYNSLYCFVEKKNARGNEELP